MYCKCLERLPSASWSWYYWHAKAKGEPHRWDVHKYHSCSAAHEFREFPSTCHPMLYLVISTSASLTQKGQKCKLLMIRNSKSPGIPLALRHFPQHNICSKGRQSSSAEEKAREKAWMAAGVSRALSEPGKPPRKPAPLPQSQAFFKGSQAVLKGRGSNPAQENCLKSH